ncbi:MAG: hypothetical protein U0Z53_24300 [Blastocatellia bacterium]
MSNAGKSKVYDQAGKFLSDHDPVGFLRLLGAIESDENVTVEILERELVTPSRAVDQLFRVTDERGSRLVHGEVQTHWKGAVPSRVADYGARIYLLTGESVESYVLVLLNDSAAPSGQPAAEIRAGDLYISKGYRLIRLWELDAGEWLEVGHPYLFPLLPLMRDSENYLNAAVRNILTLPDEHQRAELTAYFAIMSGLRYDRSIIEIILKEAVMHIPLELMQASSIGRAWLEQWREDGLEEGREKGREEGRAAAVREMVRRAAARFFPGFEVGPELERIADLEALEDLCLTMHELPDVAALQARLAALQPSAE